MNIIWLLIVLVTILYCLMTGNVGIINDVFLNVGKETLDFVVPAAVCDLLLERNSLHRTRRRDHSWTGTAVSSFVEAAVSGFEG